MCCTNNIQTYTPYITAIGGAAIGGFISYLAGATLARRNHANALDLMRFNHENADLLAQRNEFNKAAAEFRAVFVDTISLLRRFKEGSEYLITKIITDDVLVIHEKAKILFESYLTKTELSGFNVAWNAYVYCRVNYDPQMTNTQAETGQYFLDHIDNLLKYADRK